MARRIRNAEFNGNLFVTSDNGVLKSTSAAAEMTLAGLPRCLDISVAVQAGGVLYTASGQVAGYRVVWGIRDANNNLIYGAPSNRAIFTSTGVNQDANVAIRIPPDITIGHLYQVYRTVIGTSTDPGDEQAQVYENNPTAGEIAAGILTYRDIVADVYRGDLLYTNTSQEGIENANERPPLARDLVLFRDHLGYVNYTDKQRLPVNMIGTSGLIAGTSTVTIGGVVYTAQAAETIASGFFQLFTAGTAAQNTDNTAKSLCRVINGYAANNLYYAYYMSTPDTVPGIIMIEERGIGGSAFVATANSTATGAAFSPPIPTSGTTFTSAADRRKNRIRWSKQSEVEAVPLYRDTIVGAQDDEIQRAIALTDSVMVIKDRSIWRITGSVFEDFVCTRLDDTTSCAGRDSYVKLNNTIFGLSNQGFIAVGENGVQLIGRPIENRIAADIADTDGFLSDATRNSLHVAGSCEAQRIYYCRVTDPSITSGNSYLTYVYNAITRSWTTWDMYPNCWATINDRIYFGRTGSLSYEFGVSKQRNYLDTGGFNNDHFDYQFQVTVLFVGATTVTISATDARISAGCKFKIASEQYLVTAVDGTGLILTLNRVTGITTGVIGLMMPIPVIIEWEPRTFGNPALLKQYGRVKIKCETQDAYSIGLQFFNELDTKYEPFAAEWNTAVPSAAQTLYVPTSGAPATVSSNDFGTTRGPVRPFNSIPHTVPPERAFGEHLTVRLTHSVAESRLSIKALNVETRDTGSTKGQQ